MMGSTRPPPFWYCLNPSAQRCQNNLPLWVDQLNRICCELKSETKFYANIDRQEDLFPKPWEDCNQPGDENGASVAEFDSPQLFQTKADQGVSQEMVTTAAYLLSIQLYLSFLVERMIEILEEKVDVDARLHEDNLQTLRILKGELQILLSKLDLELLEYSTQSNPSLDKSTDEWRDLPERKESIEDLLKKLDSKVRSRLQGNHSLGFLDLLADIVGLRRDVVHFVYEDVTSFWLDHVGLEKPLHQYFDVEDVKQGSLKTGFESLGFTEIRAVYLESIITRSEWQGHITPIDFAHHFIQDIFQYDLLLTDGETDFPNDSENEVYELNSFVNEETTRPVSSMNTARSSNNSKQVIIDAALKSLRGEPEDGFEYWYHGTDIKAAKGINKIGIIVQNGLRNQDFSDGNGFYLSNFCEAAVEYANMRPSSKMAVLRYKIPVDFFTGQKDGHDLCQEKKKWEHVVGYFRSGRNVDHAKLGKELNRATYIRGPLSRDGGKKDPNLRTHDKDWHQLCVIDASLGVTVNKFMDFVLFVKKV